MATVANPAHNMTQEELQKFLLTLDPHLIEEIKKQREATTSRTSDNSMPSSPRSPPIDTMPGFIPLRKLSSVIVGPERKKCQTVWKVNQHSIRDENFLHTSPSLLKVILKEGETSK